MKLDSLVLRKDTKPKRILSKGGKREFTLSNFKICNKNITIRIV